MKRLISVLLAVIMVLAMSSSVFAAGTTSSGAKSIALKNAKLKKSQVRSLKVKYDGDDGEYDVKFIRKKDGAKFSYEIRKSNGKIYDKSIKYKYKRNSSKKKIGKLAAQKKAAKKAKVSLSTVKKGKCKYEYDDGKGIYEIEFRSGNKKYDVEILAPTGKIIEHSWEYNGN